MKDILSIGLLIVFALLILFVLSSMGLYWYLSWFDPSKLRDLEAKRIKRMPFDFRSVESRLNDLNTGWWLWYIRIVTTFG